MKGRSQFVFAATAILVLLLTPGAARSAMAQPLAASFHHTLAAVVGRDLGLPGDSLDAAHLKSMTAIGALPAADDLYVESLRSGFTTDSWLLRLACRPATECLPFHVVLYRAGWHPPEKDAVPGNAASLPQPRSQPPHGARPTPLVRPGDAVQLIEERPGLRLVTRAVCLERGGIGDAIRVRNLATHQVRAAIVVDKDRVRVE